MAKMTKGYSFAFQVLGYFTWLYPHDAAQVRTEYRQYLEEYVYEKIWSELSPKDRTVLYAIANAPEKDVASVREALNMTSYQFTPYRTRLIRKGIIDGDLHGTVPFVLPLFEEFVLEIYDGPSPDSTDSEPDRFIKLLEDNEDARKKIMQMIKERSELWEEFKHSDPTNHR